MTQHVSSMSRRCTVACCSIKRVLIHARSDSSMKPKPLVRKPLVVYLSLVVDARPVLCLVPCHCVSEHQVCTLRADICCG